NAGFGAFWFLGSWLMGALYDKAIVWLVVFSVAAQLASLPFFFASKAAFGWPARAAGGTAK
ncbi:hypothetical protein LWX53_06070, partial [bacterium]|nr:hypothetical protein [bacterium]